MKTINYCGMTFEVEDRFKYIATDDDGSIWVFEREPEYDFDIGEWLTSSGDYQGIERNLKQPEDSLENI